MQFKLGELFCGPGGMALGAKLAIPQISVSGGEFSIAHVWGVDKDVNAIKTYKTNLPGDAIACDALQFCEINEEMGHKTIADFERVNALAFGFPCNDFSLVGKKRGLLGKFGSLYKAGIAAIEYSDPYWFIAENVSGIHSADSGSSFSKILHELEFAGKYHYNLSVHLYKFEEYGVPQYRHRYIIVGIRKDKKLKFEVPAPTHKKSQFVSAKEALTKEYRGEMFNCERTRQARNIVERLLFTPPWHNAWHLDKILNLSPEERRKELSKAPWYDKKIAPLSDQDIISRIENCKLNCTKARMSHIYKRLDADRPSYTITGSGGGGTHVYHWKECRALTNRERARLQSFPDWFEFKGSKEQVRKQIGMAVPPLGAKIIFEAVLKSFAGIKYPFVEASYDHESIGSETR